MTIEGKQAVSKNTRATTYFLPLLSTEVHLPATHSIVNSYLFFNRDTGIDHPIGVMYDVNELGLNHFVIASEVSKSQWFKDMHELDDNKVMFMFEFPDQWKNDYDLLKDGQYSKISKDAKNTILEYTRSVYKYQPIIDDLAGILWKRKDRKTKLEKMLAMSIPDDVELGSKIVPEQETFNFEQ